MKKALLIVTLICFAISLFTSCEKSTSDSQHSNIANLDNISTVNLTVTNDDFIPLKEISQKYIPVDAEPLDEAFKNTIISTYWVGEKIVVESFPKDKNGFVELGVFDPYDNNYEKITDMSFVIMVLCVFAWLGQALSDGANIK